MAYVSGPRTATLSLGDRLGEIVTAFREAHEARRTYRRTLNELQALSNRELADLGIVRSQIRGIALEAAYGKGATLR